MKVLPTGKKPMTERQVRPLAELPPGERAAAWNAAVEASLTGAPTTKEVESAVSERTGEPPEPAEASKTTLRWLTHYWRLATDEERRLFDNFRAGIGSGR